MQARLNEMIINEIPKFLASNQTNETQAIIGTDPYDPAQQVILHLAIHGVTTYFSTRPITKGEMESGSYPSLELRNEYMEWDLRNKTYEEQENAMTVFRGNVIYSNLTAT